MLAGLRDTLDKVVPQIKDSVASRDHSAELQEIMKELGETEAMIAQKDGASQDTISEKARGMAAAHQHAHDINKSDVEKMPMLTPEHLRFLARQLKIIKV